MIEEYDGKIKEYNSRISEMASEFADMLRITLSKLQERIEFGNKDWPDETNADIMKTFDQITGANKNWNSLCLDIDSYFVNFKFNH